MKTYFVSRLVAKMDQSPREEFVTVRFEWDCGILRGVSEEWRTVLQCYIYVAAEVCAVDVLMLV